MSSARSSADPATDPLAQAIRRAADDIARAVVSATTSNPVVLIDGRSGAGKTTLARTLITRWPLAGPVQSIALDSVYPGWDGLEEGVEIARRDILVPHARGMVAVWRRHDWEANAPAEAHAVDPSLPLVVEGAGILTPQTARLADIRVWVDAPPAARKRRALDRDGDAYRPHWDRWAAQEDRHIAEHAPAEFATVRFALP